MTPFGIRDLRLLKKGIFGVELKRKKPLFKVLKEDTMRKGILTLFCFLQQVLYIHCEDCILSKEGMLCIV